MRSTPEAKRRELLSTERECDGSKLPMPEESPPPAEGGSMREQADSTKPARHANA